MSNEAESTEKYDLEDLGAEMSSRKAGRGLWLLVTMDVVFGLLDLILCGFFVYWSFAADGVVLFAWHPSLLSIGFILFMTEAINVYNNAVLMNKGRKSYSYRVLAHWVLHTFAMICITGGFAAIVWNKIRLGKHHFKTPHAIVGLITFILMFLVAAGGIATNTAPIDTSIQSFVEATAASLSLSSTQRGHSDLPFRSSNYNHFLSRRCLC
ncbi:unnamed protein product [Hermetia illucens]|uniref:ascorbate ferrireductase (transmembrane) n=1 Tax=Hermetia illucens TaxID=343691 RepID=A0A7R8YYR4_HERIL|nr:unnamed protein product [Hermetia illucens]